MRANLLERIETGEAKAINQEKRRLNKLVSVCSGCYQQIDLWQFFLDYKNPGIDRIVHDCGRTLVDKKEVR